MLYLIICMGTLYDDKLCLTAYVWYAYGTMIVMQLIFLWHKYLFTPSINIRNTRRGVTHTWRDVSSVCFVISEMNLATHNINENKLTKQLKKVIKTDKRINKVDWNLSGVLLQFNFISWFYSFPFFFQGMPKNIVTLNNK